MNAAVSTTPTRTGTIVRVAGRLTVVLSFALLVALGLGPRTGRYQFFTVLTASMGESIPAGSVVLVRPVRPAQLRVGDVITYRIPVQDRRVVTHRVVELFEAGAAPTVRTKGDALEQADAWTTRFSKGPVWRVEASLPHAGTWLRAMQRPTVKHAMVLGAPALLAVILLAGIWRPVRRKGDRAAATAALPRSTNPPFDGVIVVARGDIRLPTLTAHGDARATVTPVGGPGPIPAQRADAPPDAHAQPVGATHTSPEHTARMRELVSASFGDWSRHE